MKTLILWICGTALGWAQSDYPEAIMDNSFLIEEAYNQEPGVVQHISNFVYDHKAQDWTYSFTQEWPVVSQRHQLSFSVPLANVNNHSGIGDIAVNYRYQAAFDPNGWSFSPRLTLFLPTGDVEKDLGSDPMYYQLNFPVSVRASSQTALHVNAGTTLRPGADVDGDWKNSCRAHVGASAIWLVHQNLNLMFEWTSEWDQDGSEWTSFLNPGFRWAKNFGSLQIVPGASLPIELTHRDKVRMVFLYLSLEHPF